MKGLCECGCGQLAPIAKENRKEYGHVKGEPIRFIHNHHPRVSMLQLISRNVDLSGECFVWTGGKIKEGYGRVKHAGKDMLAHRASYEFFVGPIPKGMLVCHHCDNPACIRPDHLFIGTDKDNHEDCAQKGRTNHGEKNPHHKLSSSEAKEIYDLYLSRALPRRLVAETYGVSCSVVRSIGLGITWRRATEGSRG